MNVEPIPLAHRLKDAGAPVPDESVESHPEIQRVGQSRPFLLRRLAGHGVNPLLTGRHEAGAIGQPAQRVRE